MTYAAKIDKAEALIDWTADAAGDRAAGARLQSLAGRGDRAARASSCASGGAAPLGHGWRVRTRRAGHGAGLADGRLQWPAARACWRSSELQCAGPPRRQRARISPTRARWPGRRSGETHGGRTRRDGRQGAAGAIRGARGRRSARGRGARGRGGAAEAAARPTMRWPAASWRAARGDPRGDAGHAALVPAARAGAAAAAGQPLAPDATPRAAARCWSAPCTSSSIRAIRARPPYRAAVDAARLLGQARAAGLVNAVLRRYLREREALLAAGRSRSGRAQRRTRRGWSQALRAAWPADLAAILAANNAHPPLSLRVDCTRTQRRRLPATSSRRPACPAHAVPLAADRRHARAAGAGGEAARLRCRARLGAGCAARSSRRCCWTPRPGERVLDACAAPGGKTGALLERAGGALELTAVDIDAARLDRVADNLRRAGREARLVARGPRRRPDWWDGRPFDRILLDAPCSATGVIRRHPDIKLLRRASDIAPLARLQQRLLAACLALLRARRPAAVRRPARCCRRRTRR